MSEDICKRASELYLKNPGMYNEYTETEDKEYNKLILRKITRLQLELGIHSNKVMQLNYDKMKLLEQELSDKRKTKSSNKWIFATFNFNTENQNIDSAMKFKDKLLSKKSMEEYAYTYEQRGETVEEIGKGMHMHFLINRGDKKPAEWTRELWSVFKNYTGFSLEDFKNPKYRMLCFIPDEWAKDKIEYMSGHKWDDKKDLKCEMDVVMRTKYGLELIYKKNLSI